MKAKVLGGIGEKDSNNNTQWKQQNRVYDNNVAISITTSYNPFYKVGGGNIMKPQVIGNYSPSNHEASRIIDSESVAPTFKENHGTIYGVCVKDPQIIDDRDKGLNGISMSENCPTQRATRNGLKVLQNDLKIRKLTPRECGRLMGVRDSDIDKILANQSDSSAYHLFGDSIVVNVIQAIIGELL